MGYIIATSVLLELNPRSDDASSHHSGRSIIRLALSVDLDRSLTPSTAPCWLLSSSTHNLAHALRRNAEFAGKIGDGFAC